METTPLDMKEGEKTRLAVHLGAPLFDSMLLVGRTWHGASHTHTDDFCKKGRLLDKLFGKLNIY